MEELRALTAKLLQATDDPADVAGWVNRIGVIARSVGLPVANICWQGSPRNVASEVARYAVNMGKKDSLASVVSG